MKIPRISASTALVFGLALIQVVLTAHPAFAQIGGANTDPSTTATANLMAQVKAKGANVGQIYQIGAYSAAGVALIIHAVKAMSGANSFNFMSMSSWVKGAGIVGLTGVICGAVTGTTPW